MTIVAVETMKKIVIAYNSAACMKGKDLYLKRILESNTGVSCWLFGGDDVSEDSNLDKLCEVIGDCEAYVYLFVAPDSPLGEQVVDSARLKLQYAYQHKKRILFVSLDGSGLPDEFSGFGVDKVYDGTSSQALDHFCKLILGSSEEDSDGDTMFRLGDDYFYGWNGKQCDYGAAVSCYKQAADEGSLDALLALGNCYQHGDGVDRDPGKAFQCYMEAAKGLPDAMYEVAACYHYGCGVNKDYSEAFKWYLEAANEGHFEANYQVAECYRFGRGVESNHVQAVSRYEKAAERGHMEAMYDLGNCYQYGEGVERDLAMSLRWFERAAELGHFDALKEVADCYLFGDGVEANPQKGVELYRQAATQGCLPALTALAECYRFGIGVEKNEELAVEYYKEAAGQGDPEAIDSLKDMGYTVWI